MCSENEVNCKVTFKQKLCGKRKRRQQQQQQQDASDISQRRNWKTHLEDEAEQREVHYRGLGQKVSEIAVFFNELKYFTLKHDTFIHWRCV